MTQRERLLEELKRRNVYRVGVTYAVVGFVVVQAASLIFPALNPLRSAPRYRELLRQVNLEP